MRKLMAIVAVAVFVLITGCSSVEKGNDAGKGSSSVTSNSGIETDSGNTENSPPDDINDDMQTRTEPGLGAVASGTLTNHSSGLSGYMIQVGFLDAAGTRVADATAFVNGVQAGQTVAWEAVSFKDVVFASAEVVSVERFAQ